MNNVIDTAQFHDFSFVKIQLEKNTFLLRIHKMARNKIENLDFGNKIEWFYIKKTDLNQMKIE